MQNTNEEINTNFKFYKILTLPICPYGCKIQVLRKDHRRLLKKNKKKKSTEGSGWRLTTQEHQNSTYS
jgi:hypothetical protein